LYFYEDFLATYDAALRKRTGSYYTPTPVVDAMARLVHEVLASRFNGPHGFGSPKVVVADPAAGTGTFLLGVLRCIAQAVSARDGEGAVPAAIETAVRRLIGFEIQLGPFAVAQLRLVAEVAELTGSVPTEPLRLFVTDTLANPWLEQEKLGQLYEPIAESRRRANEIKRDAPITVVIGNPPYKEKAKGLGGWVEAGGENHTAPLTAWIPPADWGVGAHVKHLRNLYVYFWRWATWKVFEAHEDSTQGIVCFITVAGFLNGPGFARMRDALRRQCDEIWVIDASPEGHQPEVATRIFEGVQQPVCIVLASRSPSTRSDEPAPVRYASLPAGHRSAKFVALQQLPLEGAMWQACSGEWRAPFLRASSGEWSAFPSLDSLFVWNGSGVMPGRTWVIAPDRETLKARWEALVRAPAERKAMLFHPHLRNGEPGDRHVDKRVTKGLTGHEFRPISVARDKGEVITPIPYGYRSFDRQWLIPDPRVINQPNPTIWAKHSRRQIYIAALHRTAPSAGPAITGTSLIPDLDHYKGSFGGRIFPLCGDASAASSNIAPAVLAQLSERWGRDVAADDVFAYVVGIAASPAYTQRFAEDLKQPGLRIPLTADAERFDAVVAIGRRVVWLHTYGERFVDAAAGRPPGPPRIQSGDRPELPREGAISTAVGDLPDSMTYDPATRRLTIGNGFVDHVAPEVWLYEVSGKQVLRQWFSYRQRNRERPLIGDRRPPSPLGDIQPDRWLPEYTADLLDLLHVLTGLVELEPEQARLLEAVVSGPLIPADDLTSGHRAARSPTRSTDPAQGALFGDE
jgi:predicted helicase